MTDFIGSHRHSTNDNPWTRVGQNTRGRNRWAANSRKQNNSYSWGKPIPPLPASKSAGSPMKQDADALEQPKEIPDWDTTPADTNPNPWATDPAPVDANWGDVENSLIPAAQEEWVYQDPDAPLELTSINLAAYCCPIDWNTKIRKSQDYHQMKKQERVIKWVMEGTEEENRPNIEVENVRPLWKPFSNRSPHVLPGAYS